MSRSNNARIRMRFTLEVIDQPYIKSVYIACQDRTIDLMHESVWHETIHLARLDEFQSSMNSLLQNL